MAFAAIEPFGEQREDMRHAELLALLANINRDTKKRPDPYTPDDFMPPWWRDEEEAPEPQERGRSGKDLLQYVRRLNKMFGGRDLTKDKQRTHGDTGNAGDQADG